MTTVQFGVKATNYPLIPEDFERNKLPGKLHECRLGLHDSVHQGNLCHHYANSANRREILIHRHGKGYPRGGMDEDSREQYQQFLLQNPVETSFDEFRNNVLRAETASLRSCPTVRSKSCCLNPIPTLAAHGNGK
jgi:hypothetical protein